MPTSVAMRGKHNHAIIIMEMTTTARMTGKCQHMNNKNNDDDKMMTLIMMQRMEKMQT